MGNRQIDSGIAAAEWFDACRRHAAPHASLCDRTLISGHANRMEMARILAVANKDAKNSLIALNF
jgi:hypothetical protein